MEFEEQMSERGWEETKCQIIYQRDRSKVSAWCPFVNFLFSWICCFWFGSAFHVLYISWDHIGLLQKMLYSVHLYIHTWQNHIIDNKMPLGRTWTITEPELSVLYSMFHGWHIPIPPIFCWLFRRFCCFFSFVP